MTTTKDDLIQECRDNALYAYGTARIFEKRAISLRNKMRITTFFGLVVPLLFGSVALSFGTGSQLLTFLLPLTGVVVTIQLVTTLWGLIAKWDDEYGYSIGSMKANTHLWHKWDALSKSKEDDFESTFRNLTETNNNQELEDSQKAITDKEKRFAMRSALFFFKRACATCGNVPNSMKPIVCDTCGNY